MEATPTAAPAPLRVISAPRAITLARRWLRVATGFHVALALGIAAAAAWGVSRGAGPSAVGAAALFWLAAVVFVVGLSIRSRRFAADAVPLIAAGEFDAAEDRITQSLASFSVLRSTKLLGLQQLAMLRHAQSRWAEAAALARELLDRRGRREQRLETPSRLVLAESLLELGQLDAAGAELGALAAAPLDLRETLITTAIRLDWHARRDEPAAMLAHLSATLGLVELLPPPLLARTHALLAWAAWRVGDETRRAFLARRAQLLGDVDAMVARQPMLRDALV